MLHFGGSPSDLEGRRRAPFAAWSREPSACARRVVIVDDDASLCRTWARVLGYARHETNIAQSCADAQRLLRSLDTAGAVDVVLLDLLLPDGLGVNLLPLTHELCPRARVAIVTAHLDAVPATPLDRFDAVLVPKPVSAKELLQLVERGAAVDEDQFRALLAAFTRHLRLTGQQARLVECGVRGLTQQETAIELGLAVGTVGVYWQRITERIGLRPRELIASFAHFVIWRLQSPFLY